MKLNLLTLWTILICFYIGNCNFVGKLKISRVSARLDLKTICLGTVDKSTAKAQVVRCGQVADKADGSVKIWFQDHEKFSHLLILDGKSWEKMDRHVGNPIVLNEVDANFCDYAILPLLLPNQERRFSIYTDAGGLEVTLLLDCIDNHYGSRCMIFCDEANLEGRYTCDTNTGERICEAGWSGKDCSKKIPNAIKLRPKRSDCLEEPCDSEETDVLVNGNVERDFRGPESVTSCKDTGCAYPGTHICFQDEEEGLVCKCNSGYSGETCSVMDRCHFEVCQNGADCQKYENGESVCVCLQGYSGEFCESKIDNCLDDPCGEYGTCESDVTGYRCTCNEGFEGENCEVNIDDCVGEPCSGHGECYDGINSYDCDCFGGYHGANCEKADACSENPCRNGGTCSSEGLEFVCDCPEGYAGTTCERDDRDPCEQDPCNGHGTCYSVSEVDYSDETYEKVANCSCNPGYVGEHCETSVSFCDVSGICPSNSTCVSLGGEFTCVCPSGYQGDFCAEKCEDCEDEYDLWCDEDPCMNGGRCIAAREEIRCVCQHGFQGSRCDYEVDYCLQHPCGGHGNCQSTRDGYKCLCNEGYRGDRCEEDINECERSVNLCKNGAHCINLIGGYQCNCLKGYIGILCEISIDSCSENPCRNEGSCVAHDDYSYTCNCKFGYKGIHCEHKVPCEENPCQNGGECELTDNIEGYHCICEDGYHGIHCETKIHPCTVKRTSIDGTYDYVPRKDCGLKGICIPSRDLGFTCKCLPGYKGQFCDREVRGTECNEPYCVCGSTILHRKFMNRDDRRNSACTNSRYGRGACTPSDCISKSCNDPPQLVCKYDSQCKEDTDLNTTIVQGRHGICARMLITFNRAELPPETTVQGICDIFRRTTPLKNIVTVATKCFLDTTDDISSVMSLSFEATLKLNARNAREKFLKYLKNLMLKDDFSEISDETTVMVFQAIDNITDGSYVTRAGKLYRPTKPEAPRQASSSKTVIITAVCVAIVLVSALIFGVFMWMKKRKPLMTSSPVISRAENNNVPIDSVKFSKSSNGKVNPILYANDAEVFYIKTEEAKPIPPHTSTAATNQTDS